MFRYGVIFLLFSSEVIFADSLQDAINSSLITNEQRIASRKQLQVRHEFFSVNKLDSKITEEIGNSPCVDIEGVKILGSSVLEPKLLRYAQVNLLGKCVSSGRLKSILSGLSNIYIDHGYVTSRAYVKPQGIQSGVLSINVLEGEVENSLIQGAPESSSEMSTVLPSRKGNLLNLRDLEQGLEQANRLRSNNLKLEILPGERTGTSVVKFAGNRSKRWHIQFGENNHGSDTKGKHRQDLSLGLDNVFNFSDELQLFLSKNNGSSNSNSDFSLGGSYNFPHGYYNYELGFNKYDHAQLVSTPVSKFQTSGNTKSHYAKVSKVISRSKTHKSSASAKLTEKTVENYIEDTRVGISSYNLSVFGVGYEYRKNFRRGSAVAEILVDKGVSILGASDDSNRLYSDDPEAQFFKLNFGLQVTKNLRLSYPQLSYMGAFNIQLSDDPLYPTEKIGIGGKYTVRGYDNYSQSSDEGYYLRNEISIPNLQLGNIQMRPFLGLDVGRAVRVEDAKTLVGLSFGLDANYKSIKFSGTLNKPVKNIEGTLDSSPYFLGKISVNF